MQLTCKKLWKRHTSRLSKAYGWRFDKENTMKIIGLTGPSGAGKGLCDEYFRAVGIPCIDTDKVYHDLLIPPSQCADELANRFGQEIRNPDQTINRQKLASIVFSDKSGKAAKDLNAISHKYVRKKTLALLEEFRVEAKSAAVVDAPLLFEALFDRFCDFTIAVLAEREIRAARIMKRDTLSREKADERIAAQQKDEFYRSKAKYTLYNDGEKNELFLSLADILTKESVSLETK
ncbi:MAG: dephospho-CoA kinase [Ruminococcaceae bacterium]|nr:dephospho-CoA kinase [Oscillospiraceae bacterium]